MRAIIEFLFGKSCEHDWREKATLSHFYDYDGKRLQNGVTYVKECSKCHRVWAQRVP